MLKWKKLLEKFHKKYWKPVAEGLALLICGLFILAGSLISVHRYWQYEIWYYDFGIFDQAIRSLAKFQPPIIDHMIVEDKWVWADHFHPGILLMVPIYWITDQSEGLLIGQAVVIGLSAYVLFRIGRNTLKSYFLSLAVLASYVLFVGLQNAILTEFHELALVPLPLMLTYWAILKGKKWWYVAFFVWTLMYKESLFVLGLGVSFFVFMYRKEWRKLAIATGLYSLLWAFLSIKVIIPFLSGRDEYQYAPKSGNLSEMITKLFTPVLKVKTTFSLFWSFLFLPLLYVPTLPIIGLNLVGRFLSEGSTRWDLGLHYNAELAPTLAVTCVIVLARMLQRWPKKVVYGIGVLLVLNSYFVYYFVYKRPFALAYNPAFYANSQNFEFLDRLLAAVPEGKTVMTQNNLAARFTDRKVKLIRENYQDYKPEIVVIDIRPGQSPNNHLFNGNMERFYKNISRNREYRVRYHENDQYIFERITP